jgi:hypothetical protein
MCRTQRDTTHQRGVATASSDIIPQVTRTGASIMQTPRSAHLTLAALALAASPALAQDVTPRFAVAGESASAEGAAAAPARTLDTRRYVIGAPDDAALRAVREALDVAGGRFRKYFGTEAPKVRVLVSNDLTADVAEPAVDAAARARGSMDDILLRAHTFVWPSSVSSGDMAHEACHALVVAWADDKLAAKGVALRTEPVRGAHAAHDRLPAWFAEATATICEPDGVRAQRWASAGQALTSPMPLAELFAASYPTDEAAGRDFAWQSLAVLQYVAREKGDRALGKLGAALLDGQAATDAFASIGVKTATLDAEWRKWAVARAARGDF